MRDNIRSEKLVRTYIEIIHNAKRLLKQGRAEECMNALTELEHSMQVTIAMDELYDLHLLN